MGVDFYSCESCGSVFSDCGDFEWCECGTRWCDTNCANDDGLVKEYCKLGKEVEDFCCQEECELSDDGSCDGCENYKGTSCKYCRNEDYEDSKLLEYALKMLDMSRYELIKAINAEK